MALISPRSDIRISCNKVASSTHNPPTAKFADGLTPPIQTAKISSESDSGPKVLVVELRMLRKRLMAAETGT